MWLKRFCYLVLPIYASDVYCISNSNFNANIREYSAITHDDVSNLTSIKTLQKDTGKYVSFVPVDGPVNYKEVPDSALSSSSHSRGLHHEHPGYVISDYDDIPNYGHGYEYHEDPHDYKHYGHYDGHHYSGHHLGHSHGHGHHKHYEHALAAKTLLWPIAGIALLGAAAALVTNPVLLQLGVVSGRRRRDTDQVSGRDNIPDIGKLPEVRIPENLNTGHEDLFKKRIDKWNAFKKVKHRTPQAFIKQTINNNPKTNNNDDYDRFIPIPLLIKSNK